MSVDRPQSDSLGKPVIGLLGAPGSGKSAVAGALAALGCGVIDADRLGREAIQQDAVVQQLRLWWGDEILDVQGKIDRPAVGRIVFNRPAELKRLEALTHPIVNAGRRALRAQYAADPACCAIIEDCPLLLETGLEAECDALIYIEVDRPTREERVLRTRGWDAAELARRESRQWPLDIKRQSADYVFGNANGLSDLQPRVEPILRRILEQFKAGPSG